MKLHSLLTLFAALTLVFAAATHAQPPAPSTDGAAIKIPAHPKVAEIAKRDHGRTGVSFRTNDAELQQLFDAAEAKAAENVVQFNPAMKVLVEGGGFPAAYLETQSMGGEMYAKRNLEVALHNQLVFMLGQRADGRFPGYVSPVNSARKSYFKNGKWQEGFVEAPSLGMVFDYRMIQGYCFPTTAWKLYFWLGKDREYLELLYTALEAFDAYLWKTRDSNGDGLLETWCTWDTGEDGDPRLTTRGAPTYWPFDQPPGTAGLPSPQDPEAYARYWIERRQQGFPAPAPADLLVPIASLNINGYSFCGRLVLADISRELGNGRESFWRQRAEEVRRRVTDRLWRPEKHAFFDRDRTGAWVDVLASPNIWSGMYYGLFTQQMADEFIRCHLLNPAEFWTPFGLAYLAINEPCYRRNCIPGYSPEDDYCHGLLQQRAIRALENYGHYAEASMLGDRLHKTLARNGYTFFGGVGVKTGESTTWGGGNYGPMLLTALEYVSHLHGIHIDENRVWWSGLRPTGHDFTCAQRWGDRTYRLTCEAGRLRGCLNGRELFSCTAGVRVVTDTDGHIGEVVGIHPETQHVTLSSDSNEWKLEVMANHVYGFNEQGPKQLRAAPFDYASRPFFGPLPLPGPPIVSDDFLRWRVTPVQPGEEIAKMERPHADEYQTNERSFPPSFVNVHSEWEGKSGHAAFFGYVEAEEPMEVELRVGEDGPIRLWIGEREVHTNLKGTNPANRDAHRIPVRLPAGRTPITILMALNDGRACGFFLRMARPYADPAACTKMPRPWK